MNLERNEAGKLELHTGTGDVIGIIETAGASHVVIYNGDVVAVRPDERTAVAALRDVVIGELRGIIERYEREGVPTQ